MTDPDRILLSKRQLVKGMRSPCWANGFLGSPFPAQKNPGRFPTLDDIPSVARNSSLILLVLAGPALLALGLLCFYVMRQDPQPTGERLRTSRSPWSDSREVPQAATAQLPREGGESSPTEQSATAGRVDRIEDGGRWIEVDDLRSRDSERMRFVNGVFDLVGKPQIPATARIRSRDLEVFREVVDEANKAVDEATERWRNVGIDRREQLVDELYSRIRAGDTDLPFESEANPMRRRHPYEMISKVLYEGQSYVVRVTVEDEPRLLAAGEAIDRSSQRRVFEFDTVVRSLFQ